MVRLKASDWSILKIEASDWSWELMKGGSEEVSDWIKIRLGASDWSIVKIEASDWYIVSF